MIVADEPGVFCSWIAKLSSLAFSSLNLMSPYSSNLCGGGGGAVMLVEHEAVVPVQLGSTPPRLTVAVTVWPPRPVVSTVIVLVPWPLDIVPADTDQL
jgi:hypothetical protein